MVKAYLFILYLQALYLVSGSKLVEYRLGVNFGQVSTNLQNSLYGVYSLCSTTPTSHILATDRGAYFAEGSVVVIFPKTIKSLQASCFHLNTQLYSGLISTHLLATQTICTICYQPVVCSLNY